jgi:hypothetical protein
MALSANYQTSAFIAGKAASFSIVPILSGNMLFILADIDQCYTQLQDLYRNVEDMTLHRYMDCRKRIENIVQSNKWFNSLITIVAIINAVAMIALPFLIPSLTNLFDFFSLRQLILEIVAKEIFLLKEIIALMLIFSHCASVNQFSDVFTRKLCEITCMKERSLYTYTYVFSNRISFDLVGVTVTWQRVAIQMFGFIVSILVAIGKAQLDK